MDKKKIGNINIKEPVPIITQHPTQNDVIRAEKELTIILCVVKTPNCRKNPEDDQIWMDGFFMGLGIERSSRIIIFFVPQNCNIEEAIETIKTELKKPHSPRKHPKVYGFTGTPAGRNFLHKLPMING